MPAKSKSQQKLMAMALAYKRGKLKNANDEVKELAKNMSEKDLENFAKTSTKNLPESKMKNTEKLILKQKLAKLKKIKTILENQLNEGKKEKYPKFDIANYEKLLRKSVDDYLKDFKTKMEAAHKKMTDLANDGKLTNPSTIFYSLNGGMDSSDSMKNSSYYEIIEFVERFHEKISQQLSWYK